MIKQENENMEIKHSNESPSFTKEERDFIKLSIRITKDAFKYELSSHNEDDARKAVKMYHDRFSMKGGKPHELMRSIFRKMGYWHDGKTTLEERERNLIEKKMANERRLAEINFKRKEALNEQLEAIKKEKEQLENDPLMHKFDLTQEYEKIQKGFEQQIALKEQEQTLKLQRFLQEQQEAYEKTVKAIFEKAEADKLRIQENARKDAIIQSKRKLTEAMINIENVAPKVTTTEAEIVKHNEVIEQELQDIEGKTVVQLRKIAKDEGIAFSYTDRKAELIEIIKEHRG